MPPNMLTQILKLLLALPLVILLAYVSLRLTNKYFYTQNQNKNMHIVERIPVNNKSSICIVKILEEYMVIGISENGFEVIKKFSKEEAKSFELQYESSKGLKGSFMDNIKKLIKGKLKHD